MDHNSQNRDAPPIVGVETPSSDSKRTEKTATMTLGQELAAGSTTQYGNNDGAKTTDNTNGETTSADIPKSRGKRFIIDAPLIEEKSRSKRSSDPVYQLDSNGVPRIAL